MIHIVFNSRSRSHINSTRRIFTCGVNKLNHVSTLTISRSLLFSRAFRFSFLMMKLALPVSSIPTTLVGCRKIRCYCRGCNRRYTFLVNRKMEYNSWIPLVDERKAYGTSTNHLCNQTGSTTVGFSTDWRDCPEMEQIRNWLTEKILQIPNPVWQDRLCVSSVESFLWTVAPSKEEYMNLEPLTRRVQAVLGESNAQAHVSANYSMPKGGQSDPSTVHQSPVANMDMRSNLPVYGGGSYMDANTRSISNYFPHQYTNNCDTDILQPTKGRKMIYGFANHFSGWMSCLESQDTWKCQPQMLDFQMNSTVRHDVNDALSGNTEPIPVLDSYSGLNNDQWNNQLIQPYSSQTPLEVQQQSQFPPLSSINFESNGEELTNPMLHSTGITGINKDEAVDTFEKILEVPGLESPDAMEISLQEFLSLKPKKRTLDMDPFATGGEVMQGIGEFDHGFTLNSSLPIPIDVEDKHDIIGFNQEEKVLKRKVSEIKVDQEKQLKSSNSTVDFVSLIDLFTHDQITEHIHSLRKESLQITAEDGTGIDANTCQLCERENLNFEPVPIFCVCCGHLIGRGKTYFCRKGEEFDAERCFCSACYKTSKGGCIAFNGTSVSTENLEKKKNDEEVEESWVECNKCKRWQHQICALYNSKKDLDSSAEYICAVCRLREIENGVYVPIQKATLYGAKDLPGTVLSNHLEKRLFKSLMEVRVDGEEVKGNENLDKVLAAESIPIREVLSVDKQLKVKKQFLDIITEHNYPAEFSYKLRVILLFQKIDGADICIFGMYVKEFGSECGNPNQRCVYISYLDSTMKKANDEKKEVVATEIMEDLKELDICSKKSELAIAIPKFVIKEDEDDIEEMKTPSGKKFRIPPPLECPPAPKRRRTEEPRQPLFKIPCFVPSFTMRYWGFSTCYIWACPPLKRDDYILYCHPKEQKTPSNDKLCSWYHSMLK